ncbi:N-acetyltransferase [Bacillus aquiflavi]|uniref:N-acetyltransferase n=1 Tax=Bacillus aquiflavi TaxID=2672567 RepID=A0A6B3VRJ1_9BACI|nr:GNAT family N-acetyltransferase [Bacillus aquiflavi]MBA4536543.1 N-acetyltransferase [Bacillus aquiflavi]NEY80910.1 N-acetyltransferase [Bacillus aquiflavi]UAC49630.1 N-acetyltransferase [Bacillus aquiflavi]
MTKIQKGHNKFFIKEQGEMIAEITYEPLNDEQIDVNHTYVSERLRGQGIAEQLVDHVVELAREEGKKIVPTCWYVEVRLNRNEKYQDVLAK